MKSTKLSKREIVLEKRKKHDLMWMNSVHEIRFFVKRYKFLNIKQVINRTKMAKKLFEDYLNKFFNH